MRLSRAREISSRQEAEPSAGYPVGVAERNSDLMNRLSMTQETILNKPQDHYGKVGKMSEEHGNGQLGRNEVSEPCFGEFEDPDCLCVLDAFYVDD